MVSSQAPIAFHRSDRRIYIFIFATVQLPDNTTVVNHVWQEGKVDGDVPVMYDMSGPNLRWFGTVGFLSVNADASGEDSRATMKNVHGVTNALGWGVFSSMSVWP
ncbi:hypothetical protein TIFTF001_020787 [Ficus carica]|uniref:AIR12 DOMON domain-containing protein n=1 Tax=Ficus carica TaxID=3494 RepID=A0AA88AFK5_FICCA|nr:hypothetical protein TIFTF001_020787 [Ficus carica]